MSSSMLIHTREGAERRPERINTTANKGRGCTYHKKRANATICSGTTCSGSQIAATFDGIEVVPLRSLLRSRTVESRP